MNKSDKFVPSKEWYCKQLNSILDHVHRLERGMEKSGKIVAWKDFEYFDFDDITQGIALIENLIRSDERIL